MTKAPTPTEMSKGQVTPQQRHKKSSIKHQFANLYIIELELYYRF